jgi:RHS repeat-associated protein
MGRMLKETRVRAGSAGTEQLVTEYTYNAKGELIESKSADGGISKTKYNAIGKAIEMTDAQGRITKMEYDNRGMESKTIYPDLSYEETTYDAEGNVIAKRDRLGRVTKMVYDAANRLTETIFPDSTPAIDTDNPRQVTKYNAAGEVEWQQDERGHKTFFKYDLAGRQIEVKDALGRITTTIYDDAGQRTSMTDALGRTIKYVYDGAGRMIETIYPDPVTADSDDTNNPRMKIGYDAVGRKVSETDEMNRITRFTYDKLGRLTQVILPNPANGLNPPLVDGMSPTTAGTLVTKYEYDEQGNKTAQIDAEGRRTEWRFDKLGRNLTRKLPMGQVESHTYNVAGERTQHTSFNGIDTLFNYDGQGRMDKVTFPGNRIRQFTYDVAGKVTGIDDGGQSYAFEYDERDRLTKAIDSYGRAIDYQYDASNNRTQLKTAKQEISYAYDELNRLAEVVTSTNAGNIGWAADQKATYQYDEVGNRLGMTNPNGTVVSYQYDRRNRLKGLLHKASAAANAALLLGLSYTVDASGLRTQIVDTRPGVTAGQTLTRTTNYTYDSVKRLTNELVNDTTTGQSRNSVWSYSKVGNRLTQSHSGTISKYSTYTYDANDRLIAEPQQSITYSYDDNGNQLSKKTGSTVQAEYRWDEENRMVGATIGVGANQKIISYAYDPNGIRRAQEELAGTARKRTEYLIDPNTAYAQVIEEWGATGTATGALSDESLGKTYIFGDDLISQTKLALDGTGTNSFYHYDGLGTTRALSNAAGAITDRNAYTAFGENDPAGTTGWTSGTTDNNFKYTGEQLDPNLGFYYLRARYMDPARGGFVSQDTYMGNSSDPMSLHKYTYVHNRPSAAIDPSGNFLMDQQFALKLQAQLQLSITSSAAVRLSTLTIKVALVVAIAVAATVDEIRSRYKPKQIPTIWFGSDVLEARNHYEEALGAGMPSVLNYMYPGWPGGWYSSMNTSCTGISGGGSGLDCDEYPFKSSLQGGPSNYKAGRVSLKPLDAGHNQAAGRALGRFLAICKIPANVPLKSAYKVGTTDGATDFHCGKNNE